MPNSISLSAEADPLSFFATDAMYSCTPICNMSRTSWSSTNSTKVSDINTCRLSIQRSVGFDRLRTLEAKEPLLVFEADKLEKDMDMKDVADAWRLRSRALKSKMDGKAMAAERGDAVVTKLAR